MTALNAVLYLGTSKPMFLAHAKLSYFRGLTSIRRRLTDEAVCFQLLECMVRALLDTDDPWRFRQTKKFYKEVASCNLNLSHQLE